MDKKRRLLEAWKALAAELQETHGYSIDALSAELRMQGDAIPLTAFGHGLTPLEAASRYLEHTGKDSHAIAQALGRTRNSVERSLAHSHSVAKNITYIVSDKLVPTTVFAGDAPASESLCAYLREHYALTNKQIAEALSLDQRTVWTVFDRAKKRGGAQ